MYKMKPTKAHLIEKLRIFGLLLHKCWLVRKRHYLVSLVGEILAPIVLLAIIWFATGEPSPEPKEVSEDSYYRMTSLTELTNLFYNDGHGHNDDAHNDLNTYNAQKTSFTRYFMNELNIYYAPETSFTRHFMKYGVHQCFRYSFNIHIRSFKSERAFMIHLYEHYVLPGVAIIFDEDMDNATKHLHYKIRRVSETAAFNQSLYFDETRPANMTEYYTKIFPLAQLQYCINLAFVQLKKGDISSSLPDVYIQQMPYPPHTKHTPLNQEIRKSFAFILRIVLYFPLFVEASRAADEKFTGINILMAMNGISNTLNLLSWIVSGLLFLAVFLVPPILFFLSSSLDNALPFIYYGNTFLLFLVMIFYLVHLIIFGIHVSAYCARSSLKTAALLISIVATVVIKHSLPDGKLYLAPYIGIIFPSILFEYAIDEISSYEIADEGIQWYNLFTNSNPQLKVGSSIGMFFILSIIGIIFHFLLAIYVLAIYPGKYGAGKHPLFFLKYFRSKSEDNDDFVESLEYDDTNRQFFEAVPAEVYVPRIQIRNLKKEYRTRLFSKEKVHALRGVSVDFYEGEITSLLGHNGAGKTTMMSILTGMTSPTEGLVLVNSKNLEEKSYEIMQDMGLCTQEDMHFSSLTVSQQLVFFGRLKQKGKSKAAVQQDVKALLQKFVIFDKADALPKKLSGGQKRRLCLGMALIGDADILILDEPTSGVDPESRRVIWNTLLKMRGRKTILISTHNMDEADILGDRIAIMHTGQLKCYGSSLFLKRLIGQNKVEITLSIEPQSDPERIRSELHKDGVIVSSESGKLVVSIPNSPALPDTLDNLEKKKEGLGVSGFSVSLISLEQVFIKMAQENDEPPKPQEVVDSEAEILTGVKLYLQTVRALLSKKLSYTLRSYSTIILKLFLIIMALVINRFLMSTSTASEKHENELITLIPGIYPEAKVLYTSHDKSIGRQYATISENLGGNPSEVTDTNVERVLMKRAKDNVGLYGSHMIAAAEFNETGYNAFYSGTALHSLPISFNLFWNAIVKKLLGSDYSISLSSQETKSAYFKYVDWSPLTAPTIALFFAIPFFYLVALYVIHPRRETSRDVKHLQLMTGVSGFTYWGTMFLFDFLDYLILILLVIIGFRINDSALDLKAFVKDELWTEVLLLLVFGINILPITYILSFVNKKSNSLVMLLTSISVGLVLADYAVYMLMGAMKSDFLQDFRSFERTIFQLVPCLSFFHGQASFFITALRNARCRRLPNDFYDRICKSHARTERCCGMDCYNGKCNNPEDFFLDVDEYNEEDMPMVVYIAEVYCLNESFTYLCATAVLYIVLLATIESRFIRKMFLKYRKFRGNDNTTESFSDEQVEKEHMMIYEQIQAIRAKQQNSAIDEDTITDEGIPNTENVSNDRVFLVYELRKRYGEIRAVKDVSFALNRGECFGLLGVNGAGKSTTFRMMTGRDLPDHGIMYIGDRDFEKNEKYFLSQMGYCPQHDAMLMCMNPYEHLLLFARLRGIPEARVKNEVTTWIEALNLTACSRQSSRTLSGGNKRRLNIAMALIGDPTMIFMDEPTTGVDPGARRSLWNVVKSCQSAGQSVVLTSHSMEECEALCSRLAIMVDGKLVCIGASEELKQRFGAGYDIQIRMDPEKAIDQVNGIKSSMSQSLDCALVDENMGYLMYHVAPAGTSWRKMYDVMNAIKSQYDCIDEFLVLSSSLEQLFLSFARTAGTSST